MEKTPTLIYLACPYSVTGEYKQDEKMIRIQRFIAATTAAGILSLEGFAVISPITQSHMMVSKVENLPSSWDFWKKFDRKFLEVCDELFILAIEGWKDSIGVAGEIEIARSLGKPVRYFNFDGEKLSENFDIS